MIFAGECRTELSSNARQHVRRPPGQRNNPKYATGTTKFSPSIVVWGVIRDDGKNVDGAEYQRILDLGLPLIYTINGVISCSKMVRLVTHLLRQRNSSVTSA